MIQCGFRAQSAIAKGFKRDMLDTAQKRKLSEHRLQTLGHALERGTLTQVQLMLNDLHPAEIASILESLPSRKRDLVWDLVDPELDGEVLASVNDEVRLELIKTMETQELVAATEHLEADDLADIFQDLPDVVMQQVLHSLDDQNRRRLEAVLAYPEDSAGGLMSPDMITIRADVPLEVVLRYLRMRGEIPELTDSLFVVNRYDHFVGMLPLTILLTCPPKQTVSEVLLQNIDPILVTLNANEVAQLFEHHDLVSAPVIDAQGKLVGRITIDDVVDVIREEAEHSLMSMAGLDETDDMFAPVFISSRRRALWLGINLATAFLAAWVIGWFDATIEQVVALAVLMPVVASMGGVAGNQTLTLVIRGLALGQVGRANIRWLLWKELAIGFLNGLLWAAVVALITLFWFGDYRIGLIIALAMVVNLVCASIAGVTIPMILRYFNIDPALAGSVVLTTVTDVVGFFAFLGLATLFLI